MSTLSLNHNIKSLIFHNYYQNKTTRVKCDLRNKSLLEDCLRGTKRHYDFISLKKNTDQNKDVENVSVYYKNHIYENTIKIEKDFPRVSRYLKLRDNALVVLGDDMLITIYNDNFERIEILGYNASYCQDMVKLSDDLFLTAHMEGFMIWGSKECVFESDDTDYHLSVCKINDHEVALLNDAGEIKIFNFKTLKHIEKFTVEDPKSMFCPKKDEMHVLTFTDKLIRFERSTMVSELEFKDQKDCPTLLDPEHLGIAWDEEVHVYNIYTGEMVYALKAHPDLIMGISLLDEKYMATYSRDGVIKIWNLKGRNCIRTVRFNFGEIKSIHMISKDEIYIGEENSLYRFDTRDLEYWDNLKIKNVNTLAWLNDHQIALTTNREIKIHDLPSGRTIRSLIAHTGNVLHLVPMSCDHIVSFAEDRRIISWDIKKKKHLKDHKLTKDTVTHMGRLNANTIAFIFDKNESIIFDIDTMEIVEAIPSENNLKCLIGLSDNEILISTDNMLKKLGVGKLNEGNELVTDGTVEKMIKLTGSMIAAVIDKKILIIDSSDMTIRATQETTHEKGITAIYKLNDNEFMTYDGGMEYMVWSHSAALMKTLLLYPSTALFN
jgi:WD40 repeat protein